MSPISNLSTNTYKLYKRRWLVLAGYCILSLAVAPTSTCFTAVSNILQYYYDVPPISIHMSLMVFVISCLVFTLPASFILHKYGLAVTLRMAAILNLVGCVIRYFAHLESYGVYLLLTGNSFSALSLASYMFLTPKIAANWFGEHEKGTAIGIAMGFDMIAVALGFIHSTYLINIKEKTHIENGMKLVVLHQLIAGVIATVVTFTFVRSRPKTVPSLAEERLLSSNSSISTVDDNSANQTKLIVTKRRSWKQTNEKTFWESIKGLFTHKAFLVITHITSVTATVEITYEMILNDALTNIFPGKEKQIGLVGFIAVILGFFSNIVSGVVIDKTKAYKAVTCVTFLLTAIFIATWMVLIEFYHSFFAISAIYCSLLMTSTSYYAVSATHVAIVTYPTSAGTSNMLLFTIEAFYILLLSTSASFLLTHVSIFYVNLVALLLTLAAAVAASLNSTKNENINKELFINVEAIEIDV